MAEEPFYIYEGACYYDVVNSDWIHVGGCRFSHAKPPEEIIQPVLVKIALYKYEVIPINVELAKLAESMLINQEDYRDISQYVKYHRFLELPKSVIPKITIGISEDGKTAVLCSHKHAVQLLMSEEQTFGFKYI